MLKKGQIRIGFVDNAQQVRLHEVCSAKTGRLKVALVCSRIILC